MKASALLGGLLVVMSSNAAVNALWSGTGQPSDYKYPTLDKTPPTDAAMQARYNLSGIPNTKSASMRSSLYVSAGTYTTGPAGTQMQVAITFDDGPSGDLAATAKLYDYLEAHGIRVSLFTVGSRVLEQPALLRRAFNFGHEICCHTWSHPGLTTLDNTQVVAELEWTMRIIEDVTGMRPTCVRPPYGDMNERVEAIFRAVGMTKIYQWSQDSTDSAAGANANNTFRVMSNYLDQQASGTLNGNRGGIFLQHDLFAYQAEGGLMSIPYALSKSLAVVPAADLVGAGIEYRLSNGTVVNMSRPKQQASPVSSLAPTSTAVPPAPVQTSTTVPPAPAQTLNPGASASGSVPRLSSGQTGSVMFGLCVLVLLL
ncbi:hypothetical protein SeMB42_g01852 [Synchytrium endobioticum]|uniref:NodB homology domain-containing protein n=1 Tax=Synchytrium endobioticum TaxID=286115 RepID=A0A507DIX9_9FUNG|nr:hypothetical protein SeMB42_g01852 [Synchytrium endobioticum]TPX51853.1 hypothetical protein SeLEV6574_g00026 [Synchytrium endobioticum]